MQVAAVRQQRVGSQASFDGKVVEVGLDGAGG
jgi:hypothetical protein